MRRMISSCNNEIIIATDSLDYAQWIESVIKNVGLLNYNRDIPQCMKIKTRYQLNSDTEIQWFQCYL